MRLELGVEQVDHLVNELTLIIVEGHAISDGLVGPSTSTATILVKFLCHCCSVANHLNEINVRHISWIYVVVRMAAIFGHMVLDSSVHWFFYTGGLGEGFSATSTTIKFVEPDVWNSLCWIELGCIIQPSTFVQRLCVFSGSSHNRKATANTIDMLVCAALEKRDHLRSRLSESHLVVDREKNADPK